MSTDVARQVMGPPAALGAVAVLIVLRLVMAAVLPLSADEAYYWLWSKHLAAGYYDHPPAIAFVIRFGTLLLGDTELGVRLGGVLLSILASWFVWRTGQVILKDDGRAALAALLFNLTLMIGVEMLAATPDTLSVSATAGFMFFLAKVEQTGDGRWWLGVGVMGGLGLLAKYSGFFVGLGAVVWLLASLRARAFLKTPWPWAGALVALIIFLPNLWWQTTHHWMTFAFQFGRITGGHLTGRYLLEFVGAQLGLATPFILILMIWGGVRAGRSQDPRFLLPCLLAPALVYFLIHALHDRVQGNWPAFLYPMLAILAAEAFARDGKGWVSRLAVPVAALILIAVYLQAATGLLPLKGDPLVRLLGAGMRDTARELALIKEKNGARAILASDYEMTAWLRFYAPTLEVIAVDQPNRYLEAPQVRAGQGPLLYVTDRETDRNLLANFGTVTRLPDLVRARHARPIAHYSLWQLTEPRRAIDGKMP
ncbi:MAG TPA: glycosyltransferase family 39 protein [Rhizomicrobium sp.]|nr:glycosyltransferase family 39 protein [Rhizomicrobium sp.]